MSALRILQVVPSLKPTGPVRVALDLAHGFEAEGHEVHFYYFDQLEGAVSVKNAKQIGFWDKIDLSAFDIVHTHAMRPDFWGRWNRKRIKAPLLTTLHNYVEEDLKWYYNPLISKIFTKVWNFAQAKHDTCVCLSEDMKNYYNSFWSNKKLQVIPNTRVITPKPIDPNEEQLIRSFAGDHRIVMNLSEPSKRKGLDQLVQALTYDDRWVLIHYGSGAESESLKNLAKSLGVEDRILWRGYSPFAPGALPLADVMALPSHAEGFPLVLLEAVAQGVVAVISNIPAMNGLFPADAVSTFPLNNPSELIQALNQAYSEKTERAILAKRTFDENYSPAIVSHRYLNLYNALIHGQ